MTITIKKFNASDSGHTDAVCRLSKRNKFYYDDMLLFYRSEIANKTIPDWTKSTLIDERNRLLLGSSFNGYILLVDKKVVGFVLGTHYTADKAFIEYLMVDKDYRRQGYGIQLMNHYCSDFLDSEKRSCCVSYVDSLVTNEFYSRFGFDTSKRIPHKTNHRLVSSYRLV
jgi:ribosomal protein S18 acetylase RimI-like enzyme